MNTPLTYTTPERLVQDFASRGLVVLAPESLGIDSEVHERIYTQEEKVHDTGQRPTPPSIPEVLDLLNAPGLVAACDLLVGENWAIVPFTHNATFTSGARDQHWHKDDNGPYNGRKQRHHQAVQVEMLYYPQAVREDMGPSATMPYSQYWAFNHEENHDNFAGADHLDFNYHITGMESQAVSGPDSRQDEEDIIHRRTEHAVRLRDAVTNTGWPLVQPFEVAPLQAGSVVLYSHHTFHRGNHRRDDWRTWADNPRFMWRFWLYRTTDSVASSDRLPVEVNWTTPEIDPLTHIDLTAAGAGTTVVWRYHHHWMLTGQLPPRPAAAALDSAERKQEAERLFAQLLSKNEEAELARIGAAYKLASIGDNALAAGVIERGLHTERESVRRAATYGLIAVGADATPTFLEATRSPVKWVRKAGVYGLGDASPLNDKVLQAVVVRLREDPSVYVRSVAAGTLGCLGRRAVATGVGELLVAACLQALVESLDREENRLAMDRAQGRSIKFVRPTDECDVCEGAGVDLGLERFEPVRSVVRENALWSIVILCSHGSLITGGALGPTIAALETVVSDDVNVISVGFAMDALSRLAGLHPQEEQPESIRDLQANLLAILGELPVRSWEALVRGGLSSSNLSEFAKQS